MKKWNIAWQPVLLGAGIGTLTMVCICAAAAGMMAKGVADPVHMNLWAAAILSVSGLAGALTARLSGGGQVETVLTGAGELVVLLALNGALNGGKVEGFFAAALALGGGCGAAMLLRPRGRRRPGSRRRSSKIVKLPKTRRR